MRTVISSLRFAWSSRRAWWFTATARSRERFARTTLGGFWLGVSNLLSIVVLAFVYGTVFKVQHFTSYLVYLGTGIVIWNTIAAAVQSAPNLFMVNSANLRNTNTHPIFYTLEEWAFQAQTFFQSFGLVLIALAIVQPSMMGNLFVAGLLPLLNLLVFIYWFPLLVCLLGSRYQDFFQLIPILLQLMFLLSPILYQKQALRGIGWIADLNPLYRILSNLRYALIHGELKIDHAATLLLLNIMGLGISVWALERQRKHLPFIG